MKNLKILSMNLGKSFIPVIDRRKREYITDFLDEKSYDIIMLQGDNIPRNLDLNYIGMNYEIIKKNKGLITIHNKDIYVSPFFTDSNYIDTNIVHNNMKFLACLNINCKDLKDFYDVDNICKAYCNVNGKQYTKNRIITGKIPREVNLNSFCKSLGLKDISTDIGRITHKENNREIINHFFISEDLEVASIHKLVGLTEVSKIGEAYPIEVSLTHQKILK